MTTTATTPRRPASRPEDDRTRRVNHRLLFYGHGLLWAMVGLLLTVVAGAYPALVVALAWGIGLAAHGFFAVVAPELRRRWDSGGTREVVEARVAGERRLAEGRHARSLEQLSASIAHEIRNPITAAKSLVQQIGEDPSSEDNAEYARVALEELDRVERSVSHLLRYAREEEIDLSDVELGDVVSSALAGLADRLAASRARVERDLDFDTSMRGDPEKLRRVVMNLVHNALDALDDSDTEDPVVRISSGKNLAATEVWLRVRDNGPGIDAAQLSKIWSPFHSSKRDGTGLGLAITKKLVEAHGGSVEVTSEGGAGAEFLVTFPATFGRAP